ncbi:MAG TPA: UDP-2,3-diacylglucosamine diphosphatase [Pseudomonadales bacterium]|nr:UDP-2,3-diacylglucosamine diphosphatase [Pseudomonadales bacterium]HNN66462.1 UDP-2,3-diacylglucosamine diphosphatase [Pseudomonadales bacterium]
MASLFISDLHLQPENPSVTAAFRRFLDETASQAEALYILGDLFDDWVGDDDDNPFYLAVLDDLRRLHDRGVALFFLHGNRDFLIGADFASTTGATLLPDPVRIELHGHALLLAHGDGFCTQDQEYMAFRQLLRDPQWQRQALEKPLAERRAIAAQLHQISQERNQQKASEIMDVSPDEVVRVMEENRASLLIHGHTHRPDIHPLRLAHGDAVRLVLGDWARSGWFARLDESGYWLIDFPITA